MQTKDISNYHPYREEAKFKQLLRSESKESSRGKEYIESAFNKFNIKNYAVLIDHTTVATDLPKLPDANLVGLFSFDINLLGKEIVGEKVSLLRMDKDIPDCDGWLIASTSRSAVFALNKALLTTEREEQVVIRMYGGQTTEINAYIDFFMGETDSLIHLHHYFTRKYGINFPVDLRYIICECDGTIRKTGQVIIPPDGIRVIDGRSLGLGEFEGYLRVELEVENLQSRVQPFIHFYARYLSRAGICCNHQSGFGCWAENTLFNKCFFPLDPEVEVTCSVFNVNDCDIAPKAILVFKKDGEGKQIERHMDTIKARQMSYQNICSLFADVDLEGVNNASLLIKNDKPIPRPNHYFHPKNTKQFFNFDHQAGGDPRGVFSNQDQYNRFKIDPFMLPVPIFPKEFEVESYLGLLYGTICNAQDFLFVFRDQNGKVVFSKKEQLNEKTSQFINLNEYMQRNDVSIDSGSFNLLPDEESVRIARDMRGLLGFKHKKAKYICFHAKGVQHHNLPFYLGKNMPWYYRYDYSPLQASDLYAAGVVSKEYDTLIFVGNWSLDKEYSKECDYQLEVIDEKGNTFSFPRKINPQSCDVFWLSDIIKELKINGSGYYSVWTKCYDTLLFPFHLIYRKSDCAMSAVDTFEGTMMTQVPLIDADSRGEKPEFLSRWFRRLK